MSERVSQTRTSLKKPGIAREDMELDINDENPYEKMLDI